MRNSNYIIKPISEKWRACVAVVLGAILLSLMAILNGGPILFDDTGTYLIVAIELVETGWLSIPWSRPPFYSFFLYLFHQEITLWPIIFVQSAIISHLVYLVLRITVDNFRWRDYSLTLTVLALLTSVPWFTAQLTPDIFASVVVLGLMLLGFFYKNLSILEVGYLVCLTTFAIIVHFSHFPLSVGLVILFALLFFIRWSRDFITAKGLALCVFPIIAAFGIMSGTQIVIKGNSSVAPQGILFVLARYLADGPAREYLVKVCPNAEYRLCEYLDDLDRHSNWFMWNNDSPLYKIGVNEVNREAGDILISSFRDDPMAYGHAAFTNMVKQFFRFDTATWVRPYVSGGSIRQVIKEYFPDYYEYGYFDTLQNRGLLHIDILKEIQYVVAVISMLASVIALWYASSVGGAMYGQIFITIWIALLGNAFICGALSIVTDRYQSRLVWLMVLLSLVAYFALFRKSDKASWLP